jgi:hypothetical protein
VATTARRSARGGAQSALRGTLGTGRAGVGGLRFVSRQWQQVRVARPTSSTAAAAAAAAAAGRARELPERRALRAAAAVPVPGICGREEPPKARRRSPPRSRRRACVHSHERPVQAVFLLLFHTKERCIHPGAHAGGPSGFLEIDQAPKVTRGTAWATAL